MFTVFQISFPWNRISKIYIYICDKNSNIKDVIFDIERRCLDSSLRKLSSIRKLIFIYIQSTKL